MCQKCTTLPVPVEYHEEIREYILPDVPDITDDGITEMQRQLHISCGHCTLLPPADLTFERVIQDFWNILAIARYSQCGLASLCNGPDYYSLVVRGGWTFDGLYGDTEEKRRKNIEARAKIIVRKAQDAHAWQYDRFDTSAINWDTIGTDIKNKAGSIGKRISKEVKRVSGRFLPDTLIETLNNIADQHRSTDGSPSISFDQGFIDGMAKDYCNAGSCWWSNSSYSPGRIAFGEEGGYAARLWRDGKPVSRIWIIPHTVQGHDCHVIFNDYGEWDIDQWGETLAKLWNMTSHDIGLSNEFDCLYINGNRGRLLSPVPLTVSRVTLSIGEDSGTPCYSCGERYNEEDLYYSESGCGHGYCEDCIPWVYCDRCGDECWEDNSDTIEANGNYYCCDTCANKAGYLQCYHCDEWKSDDDVYTDCDDNLCCDSCSTGQSCHHCEYVIAGGRYGQKYVTTQEGNCFCENCDSECKQCPHCEEYHETGEDTCPDCVPDDDDTVFASPKFICHTSAHPGIVFPEFAPEPLQVRPVESAIDEWNKPNHGRAGNAPMAILAIDLCLSGF